MEDQFQQCFDKGNQREGLGLFWAEYLSIRNSCFWETTALWDVLVDSFDAIASWLPDGRFFLLVSVADYGVTPAQKLTKVGFTFSFWGRDYFTAVVTSRSTCLLPSAPGLPGLQCKAILVCSAQFLISFIRWIDCIFWARAPFRTASDVTWLWNACSFWW